jgi:D-alanyl-lipoteichoic acid acyltransferase DltB (MBOAT superfamily)
MLTMLLGGLWHGANWTFILWGFLHGLGLGTVHWLVAKYREYLRALVVSVADMMFYPALGATAALLLYFTPLTTEAFIYFQF